MTDEQWAVLKSHTWFYAEQSVVTAEVDRLRFRVRELEALSKQMLDAAEAYFTYHGAEHDDLYCPEDDTCQCPRTRGLAVFGSVARSVVDNEEGT